MDQILGQLGGLLLGAIPTIVLLLVLVGIYYVLVHKPLERILGERRTRTEGAMEKARAEVAAAEAKISDYERKLREARVAVFKAQEARRQKALQVRAEALAEARTLAEAEVKQARVVIEEEIVRSKVSLEAESERLAAEIVATILRQVGVAQQPGGGAQ